MLKAKWFLLGLAIGVVLSLVVLQVWGAILERSVVAAAQPLLLGPLKTQTPRTTHTLNLSAPWVPAISSNEHDLWQVHRLDGKASSLDQFKGKVVLLNFWSTTCAPCLAEMPDLERLSKSLPDQHAVVLAVTLEPEKEVRDFLKQHTIGVPIYLASEEVPSDFAVSGYPTTVILDKNGTTVFRQVGPANWAHPAMRQYIQRLIGSS